MLNKTKVIKSIVGPVLEELGFKYLRKEFGIVWIFGREVGDVKQEVSIQQHTQFDQEYKLMFWTSAEGNGARGIGDVLSKYENKEYWQAETEEQFREVIEFFASFIKEKGPEIVEDMLTEKPDPFETPERKQYFKEHRKELAEKYDAIYNIMSIESADDKLKRIDEVLWENREAEDTPEKQEEMYDLFMGLAAILCEILLVYDGAKINYDTRNVEITVPGCSKVNPISDVVQAWHRYRIYNDKSGIYVWQFCRMVPYISELKKMIKKKHK